jgi:hypothetical protein
MRIVSRFTDAYDYEESVARGDDVIYHRRCSVGMIDKQKTLQDVAGGLYLKLGGKLVLLTLGRLNYPAADKVEHMVDYTYCPVYKTKNKVICTRKRRNNFGGFKPDQFFGITYLEDMVGSEYTGKVFVNKKMAEFIKIAKSKVVNEPKVLEKLTGEVGLMVVQSYNRSQVQYVNDFSLQASGLFEAYQAKFGENIAGLIDMSLSTKEVCNDFVISDKDQLTRKGFDSKLSFRNRKGGLTDV